MYAKIHSQHLKIDKLSISIIHLDHLKIDQLSISEISNKLFIGQIECFLFDGYHKSISPNNESTKIAINTEDNNGL